VEEKTLLHMLSDFMLLAQYTGAKLQWKTEIIQGSHSLASKNSRTFRDFQSHSVIAQQC